MKFYVTTPIYYPNGIPHIGHAYTTVAADIVNRWHKLKGEETYFLTGTDEHGKKIEEAAQAQNMEPKAFVDTLIPEFKKAWEVLDIEYDRFIRTTDSDHIKAVEHILQTVFDKGDIYLGKYVGHYCTACEAYFQEKDLENGCCPIHKKPVQWLEEETYFFKLSKYQEQILKLCESDFILPAFRRDEICNRIKEGLKDISISRKNLKWGIALPFDKEHVCYVWFDALTNYLTALGYPDKTENFAKFWPADAHIMAKDIAWFHAVIWPGILFAAGLEQPKHVAVHGWWTLNGDKISKSSGNYITPAQVVQIAGVDTARYFLFSAMAFGQDGDLSKPAIIETHNTLANNLGNLVMRVSALIEKANGFETCENDLIAKLDLRDIENKFELFEFHKVLESVMAFVGDCNRHIDAQQVWKTKDKKELYKLAENIKAIAIILSPFMPTTCQKIAQTYHFELAWTALKQPLTKQDIKKASPLFAKLQ